MATVDGIIADQSARADTYSGKMDISLQQAMINAASYFNSIGFSNVNWDAATTLADVPTTTDQHVTATFVQPGGNPGAFNASSIQTLDYVNPLNLPERYNVNTTGLFQEAKPVITTNAFSTPTPVIDFSKIDDALAQVGIPTIVDIQAPTLRDISIGAMPTVTVPTFDVSLTASDPGALTGVQEQFVAEYERVLPEMKAFIDDGVNRWVATYSPNTPAAIASLQAKLQDGLDRGTALSLDYETALYNRAKNRAETEFNRVYTDLKTAHKRRRFEIPPAALMSGVAQAHQATADALALQATDVYIKRSEQEIQHIQFVLSASSALQQAVIQASLNYANVIAQINQLANEHGKFYANIAMETYKLMLERFHAQLEVYKTEAAIYETRLKAALAQLDIYKLEIEAAKLNVEVDSLRIEAYAKQVQAEVSKIQMYTSVLESIKTRALVEKSKIEIFAEQVRAYVAQLSGEELKTKVYLASLQGDELLLKAELAKLEAYSKQVDAEVNRARGDVAIQGLRAENNRMLVDVYRSEVEGYKVQLDAALASFEGELKGQIAGIDAYIKNLDAKVRTFEAKLGRDKLTLEKAISQAQIEEQSILKYAEVTQSHWALQSQIAKSVGDSYGQIAANALVAQGTMVSQATAA